jgi:hypothetical protein
MHEGEKGGVHGIYLAVDHICLSDCLFANIVTPPPFPFPPVKKLSILLGVLAEAAPKISAFLMDGTRL